MRNAGLEEAEEIKTRWQEYTKVNKKGLNDPDNHYCVATNLEPDILECEVKWALGSITMNKAVNFQMFKLVLEKAEEPDQIANILWIIEKVREFQKNIYFCFIDYAKAFMWITIYCGKF